MRYYQINPELDFNNFVKQVSDWAGKFENEVSEKAKDYYQTQGGFKPPMDIIEMDKYYILEIELPGIAKDNVSIKVGEDNILSLTGNKVKSTKDDIISLRHERRYGEFKRSVQLPDNIDINQISATLQNGILTLKISMKEPETPKVVEVPII